MVAVSISFHRYEGLRHRLWAFGQMQFARAGLKAAPDLGFFKLFGSGTGEGFTPVPNLGVYAVLATWPSLAVARQRLVETPVFQGFRRHAAESWTVFLEAMSSRGRWDGVEPFPPAPASGVVVPPRPVGTASPIAVLTRATVKLRHLHRFWAHTPGVSASVRDQDHMLFKMGLGEVPWIQQVTFSIWDDADAMVAFAYKAGAHREAVAQVRRDGFFREELYARFRVLGAEGTWQGVEPLTPAIARPTLTRVVA